MVVDRSFSDVSFYAGMLVDKFVYHIPINRQFDRLRADGIIISRATLRSQSMRAIMPLEPVYQAQAALRDGALDRIGRMYEVEERIRRK